jgi:hypothetical protein
MGSITRSFANNITTSGVLLPASLTNNSIANVTAYNAAISTGGMVLISSQTANNSASISFTTGINSTYKEYQFWFIDIHARTDGTTFHFNMSIDSGSNYNVTKTTSAFLGYHNESGTVAAVDFSADNALAQSTAFQPLSQITNLSGDADHNLVGNLSLFNPSSTTYVKHYIAKVNYTHPSDYMQDIYLGGYGNTTSAINALQFKMASGNFDGTILMYGIV